jgi:hypothetical protein
VIKYDCVSSIFRQGIETIKGRVTDAMLAMAANDDDATDNHETRSPQPARVASILFNRIAPLLLLRAVSARSLYTAHAASGVTSATTDELSDDNVVMCLVDALRSRVDNIIEFEHVR